MNYIDAWEYLMSKESVRAASISFLHDFNIDDKEENIRYKFNCLKSSRESARKSKDISSWENMLFYQLQSQSSAKRRISGENIIIESELTMDVRKSLSCLTLKGLRNRLSPLLKLINAIAAKEEVTSKTIASYALKLISNETRDYITSKFCDDVISKGTFSLQSKQMPIDKSTLLLDLLEVGKRKYTNFRRLCKSEDISFPSYNKLSEYRNKIVLVNELNFIHTEQSVTIGIGHSYKSILHQTLLRTLETITNLDDAQFPLALKIADGLDGSGSHQIYNQYSLNPTPTTKNYILFAFKLLSIHDSFNLQVWENKIPNSSFGVRPVVLIAQKECLDSIKFIMEKIINPEVLVIENEGLQLSQGNVKVKIVRSLLDGKMSGILSGAGGAHCQLCTANLKEVKDLEMVRAGFPINRSIAEAKEIFTFVEKDEYLSLPSSQRLGITHEPVSDINILSASPLHSYTCVFRWFMLLVYHLQAGKTKWSPTSLDIVASKKFVSEFIHEKTGLKIDQPSSDGGTTSTGNIARQCFANKNEFIFYISTLIPTECRDNIATIQTNLSVILRIFNSSQEINTEKFDTFTKDTYELILTCFPWASITPSLHKLLAHCTEIIRDCNEGFGLKEYSEEGLEACNKLIRRYREHLSRKNCFSLNIKDVFIRLLSQSDPLLASYRPVLLCKNCGEIGHVRSKNCKLGKIPILEQDKLLENLFFDKDIINQ